MHWMMLPVDQVVLNVAGLDGGDQSFADLSFPYEFVVYVPYGQAGKVLSLTASVTEQLGAQSTSQQRTVHTIKPLSINVVKDDIGPDVNIKLPSSLGAVVTENRTLNYNVVVNDNVGVSVVRVQLLKNYIGSAEINENNILSQRLLLAGPYTGSLELGTIEDYVGDQVSEVPSSMALWFRVEAIDGAGNTSSEVISITMVRNQPPIVTGVRYLDSRGFGMGVIESVTEGRGILVQVLAEDPEAGVASANLYYSINSGDNEIPSVWLSLGTDNAAPFQFHVDVPLGHIGHKLQFKATAKDIDGYESVEYLAPKSVTIKADEAPTAHIIKPSNQDSVIIEGQDLDVVVEVFDDLGPEGISHVAFYVNSKPVANVYSNMSEDANGYAQENLYQASITAPEGVDGFYVQAVAYDTKGQIGESQVVLVGKIRDTVVPKISVLSPLNHEIVTSAEPIRPAVMIRDIGEEIEQVTMHWIREFQDVSGQWSKLDEYTLELFNDSEREYLDPIPVSDPDNFQFVYVAAAPFVDGNVLRRSSLRNERLRIVTTVVTPNHTVSDETYYEVGLPVSEKRFLLASNPNQPYGLEGPARESKTVYYGAVDQYQGDGRVGAMVAAWSGSNPAEVERIQNSGGIKIDTPEVSGLFLLDLSDEYLSDQQGERYIYSELLAGANEIFSGTIGEIKADANAVFAGKSGVINEISDFETQVLDSGFTRSLEIGIRKDWESEEVKGPSGTGSVDYSNLGGELLVFSVESQETSFGLPFLLNGRIDLPFSDVYGLDRKDNLVFVANGDGGVRVVDISSHNSPYHIGFIKPNGFARDVVIKDGFAFIAASHQGLVVADITDPSLPIISSVDTFGVANRLTVSGGRAFVTDMSGDGQTSQLNVFDISDPYNLKIEHVIELQPARPDLVSAGVYDVAVTGNLVYVSVQYRDQDGQPAQSIVEIIDMGLLDDRTIDATKPVVIHRLATDEDYTARGLTFARGAMQVAAGKQGIARIEMPELTVLRHKPGYEELAVSNLLEHIELEFSVALDDNQDWKSHFYVYQGDPDLGGLNVTDQVSFSFRSTSLGLNHALVDIDLGQLTLLPNQEYYVRVAGGLQPLTGEALAVIINTDLLPQ